MSADGVLCLNQDALVAVLCSYDAESEHNLCANVLGTGGELATLGMCPRTAYYDEFRKIDWSKLLSLHKLKLSLDLRKALLSMKAVRM